MYAKEWILLLNVIGVLLAFVSMVLQYRWQRISNIIIGIAAFIIIADGALALEIPLVVVLPVLLLALIVGWVFVPHLKIRIEGNRLMV